MPELIDDDGLVRAGKGEAMLVGMALAALTGRRYVGYVDADNYVPGRGPRVLQGVRGRAAPGREPVLDGPDLLALQAEAARRPAVLQPPRAAAPRSPTSS